MVCDTENFLLPQTCRIGFLTVAYMQYVDTRAAMRGLSAWQCANAPRIYTMWKKSADECASVCTQSKTGISC